MIVGIVLTVVLGVGFGYAYTQRSTLCSPAGPGVGAGPAPRATANPTYDGPPKTDGFGFSGGYIEVTAATVAEP